jgi:predicted metalloprotease with PDZ domain
LAVLGLKHTVSWSPARTADSSLVPDRRLAGFVRPGETRPRLQILFPETAWGRAGFHTGDRVISWNGAPVDSLSQLRASVSRLQISDTVRLVVERPAGRFEGTVIVGGFDRPTVRITPRADASDAQRALLARWLVVRTG